MVFEGTFDRYLYHDKETGFAIVRVRLDQALYVAVQSNGCAIPPDLTQRTWVHFNGEYAANRRSELTNEQVVYADSFEVVMPPDDTAAVEYLSNMKIPGIKEAMARKIVAVTGSDLDKYFKTEIDAVAKIHKAIPTLKKHVIEHLQTVLDQNTMWKTIFDYFAQFNVSYRNVYQLFERMKIDNKRPLNKEELLDLLQAGYKTPLREEHVISCYQYCDEAGFDFESTDKIAKELGYTAYNPYRIETLLSLTMQRLTSTGHTWSSLTTIYNWCLKRKGMTAFPDVTVSPFALYAAACRQEDKYKVEGNGQRISFMVYWKDEQSIFFRLREFSRHQLEFECPDDIVEQAEKALHLKFAPAQAQCFDFLKTSGIKIITGNAGTGKTTVISGLLCAYKLIHPDGVVAMCAPTGKAAQRITELCRKLSAICGPIEAATIHKLLDIQNTGGELRPTYNDRNPLPADLIFVDEMSMADTRIFAMLLRCLRPTSTVILCGDVDQLPSVDAGEVFHDLIQSNQFEFVRLDTVYRQKLGSIITNANAINHGDQNLIMDNNFRIIGCVDENDMKRAIVDLVSEDPSRVLLTTIKRGCVGVTELNKTLQPIINPATDAGMAFGRNATLVTYHVGDRVIMLRNCYQPDAHYVNGDVGTIVEMKDESITIDFGDEKRTLPKKALADMSLAYAMTIHKSQGSEYDKVVIVLPPSAPNMLVRNLLYTAVTRAKKEVVLIVGIDSIEQATSKVASGKRRTGLPDLLALL